MVLAVWKHLQMTNIIMLENFNLCNFPRKSILGDVLAHGLYLDVLGAVLCPDGPGCPETPSNDHYYHA